MPLDGALLYCLREELKVAIGCHIDKIHMPAKNQFVFSVKGIKFHKKLFISIAPDCPRISFTESAFENPAEPPMFCMLLRKHISGGKITDIYGTGAERLLLIKVSSVNEMGDKVLKTLVCEFIGHKTNLILLNDTNHIIDAARRSDIETEERLIQPGALYEFPPKSDKFDLLTDDLNKASSQIMLNNEAKICDAVLNNIAGISPLISREISFNLCGDCDAKICDTKEADVFSALSYIKNSTLSGGTPFMLTAASLPKDYSFIKINQYQKLYTAEKCNSFSTMLEIFYGKKEHLRRLDGSKGALLKQIKNLIARNNKKLFLRKNELKKSQNREMLRIYGELIKANLYRIERGAFEATVENYYDPDCKSIKIPLNPAISPAENASRFFKDYKKACTAEQTLTKLISDCEEEIKYLDSVLYELNSANSIVELTEIKQELISLGYIKPLKGAKPLKVSAKPLTFTKNGFEIMVGKNNLQNDKLTFKIASKSDLWFHTKNIHGSHVILFTNGLVPDDETLLFAASLAAKYSKAENSNQVPVDYTPVKFVKKPNGAKPGMVIYTTNKTIFANPSDL